MLNFSPYGGSPEGRQFSVNDSIIQYSNIVSLVH